jgi:hypothetical protein
MRNLYFIFTMFTLLYLDMKPQSVSDNYVLLKKDSYEISLEPHTYKFTSSEKINPKTFLKNNWKNFESLQQTTLFIEESEKYSYLAIAFKNKELDRKSYLVNFKQSIFPHVKFYWVNKEKDSITELIPRPQLRTSVVKLPKLARLENGILLIEVLPLENTTIAPLYLLEENSFFDEELNTTFLYSLLFGLLLLQLLITLYSIALSRKLKNFVFAFFIICAGVIMTTYNGFTNLFLNHGIQLPHQFTTVFHCLLYLFFILSFYSILQKEIYKWILVLCQIFIFFYIGVLALIFINGILASKILFSLTFINLVFILISLTLACRISFYKYIFFLVGVTFVTLFYTLQFLLNKNIIPSMPIALYGFDIGISGLTLFFTLGLVRNVFAERLQGERLIRKNQIELIEEENVLNQKIEDENKSLLTEIDELNRKVTATKQILQTKRQLATKKESMLEEIENTIKNADLLIEETRLNYEKYLNQTKTLIFILTDINGQIEFLNTASENYLRNQSLQKSDNFFDCFTDSEKPELTAILQRSFKGYYFSTCLHTPFLRNNNQSEYNFEFVPIKRSNGRVVKVLCYSTTP